MVKRRCTFVLIPFTGGQSGEAQLSSSATRSMTTADRPYGMRDLVVLDPDGNHLTVGCVK